ncbi:MAG: glycosyltransferase family 2 protein [Cytophagaceae bacterium]
MQHNINISVIIPLLNEEESLPELTAWIKKVMLENKFTYEIILIDDGSTDSSWKVIQNLRTSDSNIIGIRFNRNYGKSAALNVGFKKAKGEVVITMDADLQDSPDEIPDLYQMIKVDGFDLVSGWKKKRFDPVSKTIPTKLFNYVTRKMSGIHLHDFNCGLKAYNIRVIKHIEVYGEMHRYIPVLAKWNGYSKIGEKVVQHRARKYGVTKFGLERFIYGFLDLLSITFVNKFKKRPMHFFGTMGVLSFFFGLILTLYFIGKKAYYVYVINAPLERVAFMPEFYLALVALIIGVQLFLAGFLGEMMIMQSDKKNDYIIDEMLGCE